MHPKRDPDHRNKQLVFQSLAGYTHGMHVAALTLNILIPGCKSLKQKRSRLKPLLSRLHREFNISAAEIGYNDHHSSAVIACVVVANDVRHVQRLLSRIPSWIEKHRPDLEIVDDQIEIL
jgi:uncharacterized protein YlxP (DUF503 family)